MHTRRESDQEDGCQAMNSKKVFIVIYAGSRTCGIGCCGGCGGRVTGLVTVSVMRSEASVLSSAICQWGYVSHGNHSKHEKNIDAHSPCYRPKKITHIRQVTLTHTRFVRNKSPRLQTGLTHALHSFVYIEASV